MLMVLENHLFDVLHFLSQTKKNIPLPSLDIHFQEVYFPVNVVC